MTERDTTQRRLTAWRRRVVDRVFDRLLDLAPEARSAELAQIRRRCPRVGAILDRLLHSAEVTEGLYEAELQQASRQVLSGLETDLERLPEGTSLGPWQIDQLAGQGGMGLVYRAHRADGRFERQVAIKLMRRRHAEFGARLASEIQLLARLDHPAVARILDAGQTEDGRVYMVMDWVDGQDLDVALEAAAWPQDRILDLFGQIADAIAHAHRRLVVHGDIKPSNVRVRPDGSAVLLDFGVARLQDGRSDDDTGSLGFTPSFAAPEQRAGEAPTTQTDIWALGALLAWMVGHGRRPDPGRLDALAGNWPRPRALAAILRRAMADDPEQRYPSVDALLEDLRRWRNHLPVDAQPAGWGLRIRLWLRRNWLGAGVVALVLLVLVGALAVQTRQARIIAAERDIARFEADRSVRLRAQLALLFRDAADADPAADRMSARDLLERSAELANRLFADDPAGLTAVKSILAEIFIALDDFQSAEPLLREVLASDRSLVPPLLWAMSLADMAQIEVRQGQFDQALAHVDQALAVLDTLPGDLEMRRADLLGTRGQALRGLGRRDAAVATLEQALALAERHAPGSRLEALLTNNLGTTLFYSGRADEALPVFEAALDKWRALGLGDSPDALTVMGNLSGILHQRGDLDRAERLYLESIRLRERDFGASGALGAVYLNYASLLALLDRTDEAQSRVDRGLEMIVRFEGADSINHARALLVRGRVLHAAGNLNEAAGELDRAMAIFERLVGADHLFTTLARLERTRVALDRHEDGARAQLAGLVVALEGMRPGSDLYLAAAHCEMARVALIAKDARLAREQAEACEALRRERLPESSWQLVEARALSAGADLLDERPGAREHLAEALEALAASLGPGHPDLQWWARWQHEVVQ